MSHTTRTRVGVVFGGTSAEREVSVNTGRACADALRGAGYEVVELDWTGPAAWQAVLDAELDVAFLALHGGFGENGSIQGLLNCARIPYTGSGVLASALAMDKVRSKRLFAAAGVPTPDYAALHSRDVAGIAESPVGYPCVVKPACEGSSVGVTIVKQPSALPAALELAAGYGDELLVEVYVKGPELSVGIFDGEVLGTVEIAPAVEFYTYEAKYKSNATQYRIPPLVEPAVIERAERAALHAYGVLGCRGVARIDFIADEAGNPWLLEINTLPGFTSTSLVPKLARARGIEFGELLARMVRSARTDGEGK